MSGHSKWSKVKHQKKTTDAVKSKAFTHASRAITVAVKEGGGVIDPDRNFRLRLAIEKAKDVNMPKDTIDRAISRGLDTTTDHIEQVLYEGYGPGGIAVLVDVATDNRNRTGALMKNMFDRAGGSLVSPGAVSFQFVRCGVIVVTKHGKTYDQILDAGIASGADDVVEQTDVFEVYTSPDQVFSVRQKLFNAGWGIETQEIIMKPVTAVAPNPAVRQDVEKFIEDLEEIDDVQHVFSTLE